MIQTSRARSFLTWVVLLMLQVSPAGVLAEVGSETVSGAAGASAAGNQERSAVGGLPLFVAVTRAHLRLGPGSQFDSAGIVSAGQALRIVEQQNDWVKVRTDDGTSGWISRKSTTAQPPDAVKVKGLEQHVAGLAAENERLVSEIRRLSDGRQDLELEASKLRTEVAILTARSEELKSWRLAVWTLLGLLVLLVGWGLGYLTGVLRRQADDKRYNALMREAAGRRG